MFRSEVDGLRRKLSVWRLRKRITLSGSPVAGSAAIGDRAMVWDVVYLIRTTLRVGQLMLELSRE